jgi:hypothetical protein
MEFNREDRSMNQIVKISRGTVVGIGKVKIPRTQEFNYEIPMLSFLVVEDKNGKFVSSCIHLRIDGYGTADDIAVENMIDNIKYFLNVNFSRLSIDDAWFNLKDLSHTDDNVITELWNAYHDVQFNLAAMGIPTDSVEILKKRINQLQLRIDQLESENTQLKEELSLIVDYTSLRRVA